MCADYEYCPLGLIDNCIPEKSLFTDKISCVNFYYCVMQTSPWGLPFTYEEIDGIMALIVINSAIHTAYDASLYYRDAIKTAVIDYGWGVAEAIKPENCSDLDDVPW